MRQYLSGILLGLGLITAWILYNLVKGSWVHLP
jgi:hypothetical protein